MTTTCPSLTVLLLIAQTASSSQSKHIALPLNFKSSLSTPDIFTTLPFSEMLPYKTANPGLFVNGASKGWMTFEST